MPPDEPSPFHLREPEAVEALLPGWWLPHILIGGTLLVAALLVAILLVRAMKRPRPANPAKIREEARLKAVAALESARGGSAATPREAAVLASLALRDYLSTAAEDPALFETHEEFIARRDSLAALHPQAREAAANGFTRLAALKYAANPPQDNAGDVVETARTLLDTLHRGFTES